MQVLRWLLLSIVTLIFTGCANINTIDRSTDLPDYNTTEGKAIHLDAAQRLLVVNHLQKYCSEPSPDAMTAFASSLGFGLSEPKSQLGVSLAQSLQSSATNIGLRTQSITIMRDALYRMCEAYSNGSISDFEVAGLLKRSQDLTAVILAIEQLTGVVAVNQVTIGGSSSANASSVLVDNQEALDVARRDEEEKTNELKTAKDELKKIGEKVEEQEKVKEAVKTEQQLAEQNFTIENGILKDLTISLQNLKDNNQTDETLENQIKAQENNVTQLEEIKKEKEQKLSEEEDKLKELKENEKNAQDSVDTKEKYLAESTKVRETIEKLKNSSLTSASSSAKTIVEYNPTVLVHAERLSKEATETIAKTVENIVTKVLDKSYAQDYCMSFLLSEKSAQNEYKETRKVCSELVTTGIEKAILKTKSTNYKPDDNSMKIEKLRNKSDKEKKDFDNKLKIWLNKKGYNISPTLLINGEEYKGLREKAIKELELELNK